MKIEDKIYKLGLMALDELLLHRNVSKETKITIEDASILSDIIVHVGPHAIFTFDETEIKEFYQAWGNAVYKERKK
jgi:hydrogenase maturation factor